MMAAGVRDRTGGLAFGKRLAGRPGIQAVRIARRYVVEIELPRLLVQGLQRRYAGRETIDQAADAVAENRPRTPREMNRLDRLFRGLLGAETGLSEETAGGVVVGATKILLGGVQPAPGLVRVFHPRISTPSLEKRIEQAETPCRPRRELGGGVDDQVHDDGKRLVELRQELAAPLDPREVGVHHHDEVEIRKAIRFAPCPRPENDRTSYPGGSQDGSGALPQLVQRAGRWRLDHRDVVCARRHRRTRSYPPHGGRRAWAGLRRTPATRHRPGHRMTRHASYQYCTARPSIRLKLRRSHVATA